VSIKANQKGSFDGLFLSGQRVVRGADEWDECLSGARIEAKNSFGDEALIVERYVERGRHVEVQVKTHKRTVTILQGGFE
jgi:acetyl/propionyl-CoA carboxylase alpha subunit